MINLKRPVDDDPHTYADFAELLCMCTDDRICSREYLRDYISDMSEKKLTDDELADCFANIGWRKLVFGEWYPFEINNAKSRISGVEQLTQEQKVYFFLLCCSSLSHFDKRSYAQLTDGFEEVSLAALAAIWPAQGTVRSFGKNLTDYPGSKWERMNALGEDIGASPKYSATSFRRKDSGDGGIDLIAWLDLDSHEKRNIPSAFGQCACSRSQWQKKQMEASNSTHATNMAPSYPWLELMFIPQSFRSGSGAWAYDGNVAQVILVDRHRLINCLGTIKDVGSVPIPDLLDEVLEFRLELV